MLNDAYLHGAVYVCIVECTKPRFNYIPSILDTGIPMNTQNDNLSVSEYNADRSFWMMATLHCVT